MANTIMPTVFASGTRRLRVLSGWPMLGASPDIVAGMIAEGYDPSVINSLAAAGATDAQLQRVWDATAAGSQEFAVMANQLLTGLTQGPGGAASAPDYPQAAVPTTISTAFGVYDLTQDAAWNAIAGLFVDTQKNLNSIGRAAPKDADVIDMVTQFNSLVGQYASYYQQAFGSAPSSVPLASLGSLGVVQVAVVVLGYIAVGMAALLGTLYLLNQRALAKAAVINAQGASQTTANVGTLTNTYAQQVQAAQAAYAAGNKALGDQLSTQAQQTAAAIQKVGAAPSTSGAPVNFTVWLQQNVGWLALGVGGFVLVSLALKRK